jgi:hypothetical protein
MHRPGFCVVALLVPALAILTLAGCSGGPESSILNQFFSASRLADNTALNNFTMVSFEPETQGTVTSFAITSISPEQRKPLALTARAKALEESTADDAGVAKRKPATEGAVAELSINGGSSTPLDISKYEGEVVSKDVTIAAAVKSPTGDRLQKALLVTMQRAVLKGDKAITGRWIITAIKDAALSPGSPATPRS